MKPAPTPADTETGALAFFQRLAAGAQARARMIGVPVAVEDHEVHEALKAAGHKLTTVARQRLATAVGLYTFPASRWSWHSRELRMFCTAPVDPRPQAAWDEVLWLPAHRLLEVAHEGEEK